MLKIGVDKDNPMTHIIKTDVCVIGAGSAGLSVAVGAAQMGVSVVLIEKNKMGGDCLNTGCIPSKSLLAAAKAAHMSENMSAIGLKAENLIIDHAAVHKHIQDVIKHIAPHDSTERMESLGIKVIHGMAQFINEREIKVGDTIVKSKRFVIATGSKPIHPEIAGLDKVPFFTNETIFNAQRLLDHLIIIGGGPIGMEMAQAHRRLGSKVTLLEKFTIMPRDDQEAVNVIRRRFKKEGIELVENVDPVQVAINHGVVTVSYRHKGELHSVEGSHLMMAVGRTPNVRKLQLDLAGISYNQKGIVVNEHLRTHNHRIYAIGDVIGQQQFTHAGNYHAGIVLRNMLFRMSAKVDPKVIPWVTFTDPELAQAGMTEAACEALHMVYKVYRFPFEENDRAQCERQTEGLIKVVVDGTEKIIGVTICGHNAGELISFWLLAMAKNVKFKDIARLVLPYPTYSEVHKGITSAYFRPIIFSKKVQWLARFLMKLTS